MPALSQNLIFHPFTNTDTVSLTHTAGMGSSFYSDKIKGEGYFGGANGFHTVFWKITNFVGTIQIQGTLASNPQDDDWVPITLMSPSNRYSVDTTGLIAAIGTDTVDYTAQTTESKVYNFTGNFVWLRAHIDYFTIGTMNGISINR
jgi:hypothetical protein